MDIDKMQIKMMPKIEDIILNKLYPTYNYGRIYEKGHNLPEHIDRPACEISVTVHIGHEGDDWPIFITDKNGIDHSVTLNPGDALLYLGHELPHWREKYTGKKFVQVFVHYVTQGGPFEDNINDHLLHDCGLTDGKNAKGESW